MTRPTSAILRRNKEEEEGEEGEEEEEEEEGRGRGVGGGGGRVYSESYMRSKEEEEDFNKEKWIPLVTSVMGISHCNPFRKAGREEGTFLICRVWRTWRSPGWDTTTRSKQRQALVSFSRRVCAWGG